jgi:hypothetical protein
MCVERKGTAASKVPKSVCCSYDSIFKVMVLTCAEETKSLAVNLKIPHCRMMYDGWDEKHIVS